MNINLKADTVLMKLSSAIISKLTFKNSEYHLHSY